MKKLAAIALLLSFTASAAEPYVPMPPPPLLPVLEDPYVAVERPVPGYARWWVWAVAGTATVQTLGVFLFFALVMLPRMKPQPIGDRPL